MPKEGQLDLTVVVPYYNPGPNLVGHVAQVIELLRDRGVELRGHRGLGRLDRRQRRRPRAARSGGPGRSPARQSGQGSCAARRARAWAGQLSRIHRRRRGHPGAGAGRVRRLRPERAPRLRDREQAPPRVGRRLPAAAPASTRGATRASPGSCSAWTSPTPRAGSSSPGGRSSPSCSRSSRRTASPSTSSS